MSDRKPRLGLTQRVTIIEEYGERRDCLDQAWTTLLEEWGYQPVPLPNTIADVNTYLESLDLDGIVFDEWKRSCTSGGRNCPSAGARRV